MEPAISIRIAHAKNAIPRFSPIGRAKDSSVDVCAKCTVSAANPSAAAAWAAILALFVSPSDRRRRTFSRSSANPIAPNATVARRMQMPAAVTSRNTIRVTR